MIRRPPISTLFPNPPLFRSARDVEQVIDEPHQVLHLPLDDDAFSLESRLSAQPDELKRGEDGRKWISERSEEHTSELQSPCNLVCRLLLDKKKRQRRTRSGL